MYIILALDKADGLIYYIVYVRLIIVINFRRKIK